MMKTSQLTLPQIHHAAYFPTRRIQDKNHKLHYIVCRTTKRIAFIISVRYFKL